MSFNFKSLDWKSLVELLVPVVLARTPLAPITSYVVAGIHEAEAIPGASGADKLAHSVVIAQNGIAAVNAQAGHQVINPTTTNDAIMHGISTAVDIANLIHKS